MGGRCLTSVATIRTYIQPNLCNYNNFVTATRRRTFCPTNFPVGLKRDYNNIIHIFYGLGVSHVNWHIYSSSLCKTELMEMMLSLLLIILLLSHTDIHIAPRYISAQLDVCCSPALNEPLKNMYTCNRARILASYNNYIITRYALVM